MMHPVQKSILELARTRDVGKMKLREVGTLVGGELPQTIKYHLDVLVKRGLLKKSNNGSVRAIDPNYEVAGLIQVPILGQANCGQALIYAENDIQGFLPVSPSILKTRQYQDIFAVQAVGSSMNASNVEGKSIQEGDYVIAKKLSYYEDDIYIVATFEGLANVKRLIIDRQNGYVVLQSESLNHVPPIYIAMEDIDRLQVHGQIIQVLKSPQHIAAV